MNLLTGIGCRALIYDILQSLDNPCPVKTLIIIGAILGYSEGVVRAAIHDLQKEGVISSPRRSSYEINRLFFEDHHEFIIKKYHYIGDWNGKFIMISYLSTENKNQTLCKKRLDLLTLMGFLEYEKRLFIRPYNLKKNIHQIEKIFFSLDPYKPPKIFLSEIFPREYHLLSNQFSHHSIHQKYKDTPAILTDWIHHQHLKVPHIAAKEAFLMSRQILHLFYIDPLFPAQFVNTAEQQHFIESSHRFLMNKNRLWQQFALSA